MRVQIQREEGRRNYPADPPDCPECHDNSRVIPSLKDVAIIDGHPYTCTKRHMNGGGMRGEVPFTPRSRAE